MARKKRSKEEQARSVNQRVGNEGSKRKLSRPDAFTAYAMDRLLYRLGRSPQAGEFFLKGGVLVANLVQEPHRFTRDVDVLRRHGPPEPDDLRSRFETVVAIDSDDGIVWGRVRAIPTDRSEDEYDGVKVFVEATVDGQTVEVRIDIGFGDAVEPDAERLELAPFLEGDPPARVQAYQAESVIAEKVETLIKRFPVIAHRLKDILDIVVLADHREFSGSILVQSMHATFARRETRPDPAVLDDMLEELGGRKWAVEWRKMVKEKAVTHAPELRDALSNFDTFVRPLLLALGGSETPGHWPASGPWAPLARNNPGV